MKEVLLLIALALAIVMDIVRILQYRAVIKEIKAKSIKEIVKKVVRMQSDLANDLYTKDKIWDYAAKHWDEYE